MHLHGDPVGKRDGLHHRVQGMVAVLPFSCHLKEQIDFRAGVFGPFSGARFTFTLSFPIYPFPGLARISYPVEFAAVKDDFK